MAQNKHIQLLNSADLTADLTGIKKPAAALFANGEIIINYNAIRPTLFVRDSEGIVREFPAFEAVTDLIDALKGGALSSVVGYRNVKEIADTLHTFLNATNDTDNVINKWKELEAFLNGIPDSNSTLVGLMSGKVDKTTTVNGKALSGNITLAKADVGLGSVDNTSDAAKPVSTAQATAIADAKKAGTDAQSNLTTHAATKTNPHGVTKAQVGLSNVDNTSDAAKPVSTAQQTALNLKLDKAGGSITNNLSVGKELTANIIKSTTDVIAYAGSDASASGMIIDDLSDVNTAGKQNGFVLSYNGTSAKWEAKQPAEGGGIKEVSFSDIKGSPTDNTNLSTSLSGKVDKVSGKGLSTNDFTTAEKTKVSTAIQSAKIGTAVVTKSGTELQLPAYPTTLPASDVSAWAKAATKPTYTPSEVGAEPAFSKNNAFNKSFGSAANTVCQGNDSRLSNARPASDVYAWAKASVKPTYSYSEITGSIDCGTY